MFRLVSSSDANLAISDGGPAPGGSKVRVTRTVSAIWPVPTGSKDSDRTEAPASSVPDSTDVSHSGVTSPGFRIPSPVGVIIFGRSLRRSRPQSVGI